MSKFVGKGFTRRGLGLAETIGGRGGRAGLAAPDETIRASLLMTPPVSRELLDALDEAGVARGSEGSLRAEELVTLTTLETRLLLPLLLSSSLSLIICTSGSEPLSPDDPRGLLLDPLDLYDDSVELDRELELDEDDTDDTEDTDALRRLFDFFFFSLSLRLLEDDFDDFFFLLT